MKCLRSGQCCIALDVIIVDDPTLGIIESNLKHKPSGIKCQHLVGDSAGHYSCAIHSESWYVDTPCYRHSQVEQSDSPCRVGNHLLNGSAWYGSRENRGIEESA